MSWKYLPFLLFFGGGAGGGGGKVGKEFFIVSIFCWGLNWGVLGVFVSGVCDVFWFVLWGLGGGGGGEASGERDCDM